MSQTQGVRARALRDWPLWLALATLWGSVGLLLALVLGRNRGFAYTLDDAYIHLSCAKNLAWHGVLGVSPYEFNSAESSIAWPLLLAGVLVIVRDLDAAVYAPLVLNLLFASGAVWLAHRLLRCPYQGESRRALVSAVSMQALVLLTSMPWLVFTGMEHCLQILVALSFVACAARALAQGDDRRDLMLPGLAALTSAARYEGAYCVAAVCLLLFLRRRFGTAVYVAAAGICPLIVFGLISIKFGGAFLPNSILLKSIYNDPGLKALVSSYHWPLFLVQLGERGYLIAILSAVIVLCAHRLATRRASWSVGQVFASVFLLVAAANLQSAFIGGFSLANSRYDAYLVALGIVTLGIQVRELWAPVASGTGEETRPSLGTWGKRLLVPATVLVLGMGFFGRGLPLLQGIPAASHNIYSQQVQMARFVHRFYPGAVIALNDIGAVDYWTDIHCVDLWGLGTQEVASAKLRHIFTTERIRRIANRREVEIAIVYRPWFEYAGGLPKEWREAGSWRIPGNVICGNERVTFFAVDNAERLRLEQNLQAYVDSLPRDVSHAEVPEVAKLRPKEQ